MRWDVTTATDFEEMAGVIGVPADYLRVAGIDHRVSVGQVEAATKGEAIMRAHQQFPRIPVEHLDVQAITTLPATTEVSRVG